MCRLVHMPMSKKIKALGPAANAEGSKFLMKDTGQEITVADYFKMMCNDPEKSDKYVRILGPSKALKFPFLPTVNVGTKSRPILIPAELITIRNGQSRSRVVDGEKLSKMVSFSAVRPAERFGFLTDATGIVSVLKKDSTVKAFGLSTIDAAPMTVSALLLPATKLQFGSSQAEPGLSGTWNFEGKKIVKPPPNAVNGTHSFGVMVVSEGRLPRDYADEKVDEFIKILVADAGRSGLMLKNGGPMLKCGDSRDEIRQKFVLLVQHKVRICIVVMLGTDSYALIKYASDLTGILTQCVKYKNVDRPPRGISFNIALKLNVKLGGQANSLVSRATGATGVYQDPPASISWILDKPCMFVGMDVTHSHPGIYRFMLHFKLPVLMFLRYFSLLLLEHRIQVATVLLSPRLWPAWTEGCLNSLHTFHHKEPKILKWSCSSRKL